MYVLSVLLSKIGTSPFLNFLLFMDLIYRLAGVVLVLCVGTNTWNIEWSV